MFELTIKTNRIYFERYEAPFSEIRRAWEAAAIEVIEEAGYEATITIRAGHDPSRWWSLSYNGGRAFHWSGTVYRPNTPDFVPDCECEECDNCEAVGLWDSCIPMLRRDAERVAELALDNADIAAQELSDKFVATSEANS